MKISRKTLLVLAMAGIFGFSSNVNAQNLSSSSPVYSEDFNSMGEGSEQNLKLPSGWRIERNMNAVRQVDSWANADDAVMYYLSESLLSNQSNGTYGFFASSDHSDRAVGGLTTGSVGGANAGTRGISLMTEITNSDPTKIITNLNLGYNIEKYRNGNNGAGFSIRIFTSSDGEKWTEAEDLITSFSADSETLGEAVVPISTKKIENANLRVHVEPGNTQYIAWNISPTTGTTCSSAPGYAIDDVTIEATFADTDEDWEEEEQPEIIPSGIYLRGEINGWNPDSAWEFSKVSETEFILYNKTISGQFKVADSTWSSSCNYGSNGTNVTMNEAYTLTSGGGNISCGTLSFNCSQIVLTIEEGIAKLVLEPNTKTTGLTAVYMVGDFNNWDYMSTAGKLTLDPSDNLFKGEVGLTAGEDGLSHWMIYQRLALAGAWGLDNNATASTLSGTLTAGKTGHVATEPGMYEVSFNLATGEYEFSLMPSVAQSVRLTPAAATIVPQLPETVKVLSLNNSLIHYNDQAKVFNDIAASMKKDATWTKHTNLGKTLQYHWEEGDGMTDGGEPGAKMTIRSDAWSHIILQEQTALPRTDFASFSNSVKQWVEYIRDNCPNPNAVIILPLNWALAQDWSNFSDYNKTLLENYEKVAQEYGVVICPVGIAYQNKYNKDGGSKTEADWFLPGDDRHPTLKATYLAALMEYAIIFNEDPSTVTYYPNYTTEYDAVGEMSDAIASEMRQYASDAIKSYKNIVDHHSASVNLKAAVIDQFDMELSDQPMTWSVTPSTATIDNGVFKANENGVYTVTATSGTLSANAVITVADAVTEVPDLGFIELSEDNLDYSQDFDSMGSAAEAEIPQGWRADVQLTPRTLGVFTTASTTTSNAGGAGFGSTAKNGLWNLGDSSDENDRALGGITTDAAGGAKSINIYAAFKNGGTKYISTIDLSYVVEKYRDGSNSAGFTVQLYTSVDGRNWKSAGSEFATDFEPSAATEGSETVPMERRFVDGVLDCNMAPGAELFLAWNISATSGESCMSAPVLSIDDVEISAGLRPVPVYDYHIYIENQSPFDKTALYAWSENAPSEIFGAWPGQNAIDNVEIDGVKYEVYGHNQETGNYHIIYNNNNNGSQFDDFDIEAGKDYYLTANPDGKTLSLKTTGVESIADDAAVGSFRISGDLVYCPQAQEIVVFNLTGSLMKAAASESIEISELMPGLYVVTATTPDGSFSKKFIKR